MTICRLTTKIAATFIAASAIGCFDNEATAGCLDWLFGRSPVYTSNYPYAPVSSPMTIVPGSTPVNGIPMANSGAVAVQRPAFGATATPGYGWPGYTQVQSYDNPSVYTGLPVSDPSTTTYRLPLTTSSSSVPVTTWSGNTLPANVTPYQASRVPIAQTLRGTTNPILPSTTYTSNYGSVAPTSYSAPISTAVPTTVPLSYEPRRWRLGSGLARFFNSLLGRNTDYVTSYYNAPITYYRPVTSFDPTTGSTVTVQQPCSSYVQQLQRVPYNTLMPTTVAPTQTIMPMQSGDPCTIPYASSNSYGPSSFPQSMTPGTFSTPSPIGQVGGEYTPGNSGVTTIPSVIPNNNGYPNETPLTGGDPADIQDTGQPELQQQNPGYQSNFPNSPSEGSSRNLDEPNLYDDYFRHEQEQPNDSSTPGSNAPVNNSPGNSSESNIQLDPPVTGRTRGTRPNDLFRNDERLTTRTPPSLSSQTPAPIAPTYSSVRPVGVPPGSQNVRNSVPNSVTQPQPVDRTPAFTGNQDSFNDKTLQPPPLPAPSPRTDERYQTNDYRNSVPVKEVTLRENSIQQVSAWDSLDPLPSSNVVRAHAVGSGNLAPQPTSYQGNSSQTIRQAKPQTVTQPAPRKQRSSAGWVPVN
ncbi:hypothetical protein [Rhodopirellula sp. MGV]|uniref:hypothetical protein n=1 Tax=Rhodopirellula sp. MGV TaxID=2023130 RepID=UPI000B96C276|nr:hypothetical protein [Rhodopirellula sp. MGV]OYP29860.1 hypothetical protein CGZ80_24025 [Rhodopirellula sp. MGV]PNY33742.1 hypothetical protein C2E31_27000 [Rhodopirellula baltica]